MPVLDKSPYIAYVANGATSYAYDFRVFTDTDLVVSVAGAVKTLATDYTVTGVGDDNGGEVVFIVPPAAGSTIEIERILSFARETDYQYGGAFREQTVDADQDYQTMLLQQLKTVADRSVLVPKGQPGETIDIIEYANRAGKVLGWNSLGRLAPMAMNFVTSSGALANPWADVRGYASLADAVAQLGGLSIDLHVSTVHELVADLIVPANIRLVIKMGGRINVAAGKTLTINGTVDAGMYLAFGGDGTVVFNSDIVGAVGWFGDTVDVTFNAGLTAHPQYISRNLYFGASAVLAEVYPEWWGVTGTADNIALQLAINAGYGRTVRLSGKTYYLSDQLSITQQVTISGSGWNRIRDRYLDDPMYPGQGTVLIYNGPDNKAMISLDGTADTLDGLNISGMALSNAVAGSTAVHGIRADTVRHSTFSDLFFERFNRSFYAVKKVFQNTFTTIAMYDFGYGFYLDSESEDNTFINCLARGYRAGSVGILQNYYSQKNVFIGCDLSNNQKGLRSLLSAGNNTTLLYSCVFELGGDGAEANMIAPQVGVEVQNSTSIFTSMRLEGCRFLYTGSDPVKKAAATAVNLVSGSVFEMVNSTASSMGNGIVVVNRSNVSKLILKNNTWPSVTTPINAEALFVPMETDTTDVNYATYGQIGYRTTIPVTNAAPVVVFAPAQTTGATWLVTVNDNSGAASRYGQVLMMDRGYNANGQIVNEVAGAGVTFSIIGNSLSITPTFTGSVKVHIQRLT